MQFDPRAFAQTHYFAEFERKKELNSGLTMPVALASAYAAGIVTVAGSVELPLSLMDKLVLAGSFFAGVSLGFALFFLTRSYVGHGYRYVAPPDEFLAWRVQARDGGWDGRELDVATEEMIADEYAAAARDNAAANDRKAGFLHAGNTTLGVALLFLIVTTIPWMVEKVGDEDQKDVPASIIMVN